MGTGGLSGRSRRGREFRISDLWKGGEGGGEELLILGVTGVCGGDGVQLRRWGGTVWWCVGTTHPTGFGGFAVESRFAGNVCLRFWAVSGSRVRSRMGEHAGN